MIPPALLKRSHADLVREVLIACNRLPGVNLFAVDVGGEKRKHGTAGVPDIIGYVMTKVGMHATGVPLISRATLLPIAVFFEIKAGRDRLRPKQRAFLELARKDNCVALEIRDVESAVKALS